MPLLTYTEWRRLLENGDAGPDAAGPSPYHRPYNAIAVEKGGPGSGNFGHEGRPGEVGGSAPGDEPGVKSFDQPENQRRMDSSPSPSDVRSRWAAEAKTEFNDLRAVRRQQLVDFIRDQSPDIDEAEAERRAKSLWNKAKGQMANRNPAEVFQEVFDAEQRGHKPFGKPASAKHKQTTIQARRGRGFKPYAVGAGAIAANVAGIYGLKKLYDYFASGQKPDELKEGLSYDEYRLRQQDNVRG